MKDITTAYSEALVEIGLADPRVVVLDADLPDSCKTEPFYKACPGRAIDLGVAEQSLPTVAAGLALAGKIPFYNTFAVFAVGRSFDMIRLSIAYARANVKIIGHAAGLSLGYAGPSHHALEDVAMMRALPNVVVLQPADAEECRQMVWWMKDYVGPVYLRLMRATVPNVHAEGWRFEVGKTELLREGSDVTLYSTGDLCVNALRVAEMLAGEGISARVVNVSTLKPLPPEEIIRHAELTRCGVTLEDHNIIGGLGSAVAEIYAEFAPGKPLRRLGIRDMFTESDDCEVLRDHYGLADADVVAAVHSLLDKT
ncbi:MAG TPA: transketolase family protein [Caldilineae bacterium]|nr:transketolase family protein [Caldilineae bacterium]